MSCTFSSSNKVLQHKRGNVPKFVPLKCTVGTVVVLNFVAVPVDLLVHLTKFSRHSFGHKTSRSVLNLVLNLVRLYE